MSRRQPLGAVFVALLLRVAAEPVHTRTCSGGGEREDGRCSRDALLSIIYITKR
jgi:hypothetical protein